MYLQGSIKAGTIYIIIILVVLFSLGFQIIGGFPTVSPTLPASDTTYTPDIGTANSNPSDNLQMKELQFTTAAPQPTIIVSEPKQTGSTTIITQAPKTSSSKGCNPPGITGGGLPTCGNGKPECSAAQEATIVQTRNEKCGSAGEDGDLRSPSGQAGLKCRQDVDNQLTTQWNCNGKPVIYLYPTKPTYVSVSLHIPGRIIQSIPTYPNNGWQDILASPDGTLTYQGNTYHELYYESLVRNEKAPNTGIIIPTADLQPELTRLTTRLGLLPDEQNEFLDYWMPKLQTLHAPYILFSVLDPIEKERVDHAEITPKPDTMIAFLVYFKPLQTDIAPVKPLVLPNPPARHGFTAIEWGGTIGN